MIDSTHSAEIDAHNRRVIHIHTNIHICIYTYIDTYIYTYTYIYTHHDSRVDGVG